MSSARDWALALGVYAGQIHQYQQAEQQLVDAVAWIPTRQSLNQYLLRLRVAGGYHERASQSTALAVWQRIYVIRA